MRKIGLLFIIIVFQSCGAYFSQPVSDQEARLGETTNVTEKLVALPNPKKPVVVGVYKFRDQTGQYKPSENGSTFSTAVTQGATTILIKALEDSKWFIPIERENLSNLLNERNIIRSTRKEYRKTQNTNEPQLPPLLYAGILLEGGIVSYDSNIITGGLGARYLGIGGSTQYREDRISIYLRAVSTSSGKILKTIYISKTILSQAVDASIFKYVKFKRLLEIETGFTKNEPVHLAVTEAIEKAVESLIIEGIQDNLWQAQAPEKQVTALLESYDIEKEDAISTKLYDRYITERRGKHGLTSAFGASLMDGDYPNPEPEFNAKFGYKYFLNSYLDLNVSFNIFKLANKNFFSNRFMSFDLNLEYTILPYDKFTPYVFGGLGSMSPEPDRDFNNISTKIQFGLGLEYLVKDNIGVYLYAEDNYVFNDAIDGLVAGKYDDMFFRVGFGVSYYFPKPKTKANQRAKIARQEEQSKEQIKQNNIQSFEKRKKAARKKKKAAKKNSLK